MADPLSVLSAAAGFVSLAGLLGEGIIKFQGIIQDVRCAQEEVADLDASMQNFYYALELAGRQLSTAPSSLTVEATALGRCLERCEHTAEDLKAMLFALSEDFKRHKAHRLKMPFKKDKLQNASRKVNDSAVALNMAISSFSSFVASHEHWRLENGIRSVYNEVSGLRSNEHAAQANLQRTIEIMKDEIEQRLLLTEEKLADLVDQQPTIETSEAAESPIAGLIRQSTKEMTRDFASANPETRSSSRKLCFRPWPPGLAYDEAHSYERTKVTRALNTKRYRSGESRLLSVPIPSAIFEQQYKLSFNKAASGFTFVLRTEIIVQRPTPLMKACFSGDLERVKEIWKETPLGERKGILYIQKKDGRTCLHNAVKSGNQELFRFLLDMGAHERLDAQGKTRLLLSASSARVAKNNLPKHYITKVLQLQEAVRRGCNIDDDELDFNDPEKHERELIIHDLLLRNRTWTLEDRLRTFLLLNSGPPEFTGTLEDLLTSFELDPSDPYVLATTLTSDIGIPNVFHLIAKSLSQIMHNRIDPRRLIKMAAKAVKAGAQVHAVHPERIGRGRCRKRYWTTPLANMFLDSIHVSKQNLSESERRKHLPVLDRPLQRWIHLLGQAGVDLVQYGKEELRILKNARFLWEESGENENGFCRLRPGEPDSWHAWFADLDGFEYGPEWKDWKLTYKIQRAFLADGDSANEFWSAIEAQDAGYQEDLQPRVECIIAPALPGSFPA